MSLRVLPLLACALFLQACGAYFNTYFNAQKAYNQGVKMRETRLERDPLDTLAVTTQERNQFNRAIVKSAKVLELWPDDPEYAPRAVFLMADSYLLMEEYDRAAEKYEEYIRFFPESERIPLAVIRRARALFQDGQDLRARETLAEILSGNPEGEVLREALLLSARMQIAEGAPEEGLAAYEQLLKESAFMNPESRAEIHWQAARLAYGAGMWERARHHALAGNLGTMPARAQYRNLKLAIQSQLQLERYTEAIAEVNALYGRREFRSVRSDLLVLRGQAHEGLDDWESAERDYRAAARLGPRTASSAEAWYRVASRFLDVENLEDSATVYFDSARTAGGSFEYGERAIQKFQALTRLANFREQEEEEIEMRDSLLKEQEELAPKIEELQAKVRSRSGEESVSREEHESNAKEDQELAELTEAFNRLNPPGSPHFYPLMIAELFLYDLQKPDSARVHLNRVVADTREDTVNTRRALYSLAWIEREEFGDTARSDSLFRVILNRYPGTEWAKHAERHLGLEPTIKTQEDMAREAFRAAEQKHLNGENLRDHVIPAFRQIARRYPDSRYAPRALFVAAYLWETQALALPANRAIRDSAIAAYEDLAERFPDTPYGTMATAKHTPVAGEDGQERVTSGRPDDEEEDGEGDREEPSPGVRERLDPVVDEEYLY